MKNEQNESTYGPDLSARNSNVSRDYSRVGTLIDYLGRTLLSLGSSSQRIEAALSLFAERLGTHAQVMSTPTLLIATLRSEGDERTFIVREEAGTVNLGKLARLSDTLNDLSDEKISVAGACQQAADIYREKKMHPFWLSIAAFMISSACAALLLGGNWKEMNVAIVLGGVAGLLHRVAERFEPLARISVPVTAMVVGFLAIVICSRFPGVSYIEPIVSGIITLLPGLAITNAARELASGHLLAGVARAAGALIVLLALSFGVGVGAQIADLLVTEPKVFQPTVVPWWAMFLVAPLMGLALSIRFQAERKDWLPIMATCVATMAVMFAQLLFEDKVIGAFLTATVVGIMGNLWSHYTQRPSVIVYLPGLLLLVPGSLSLFSFAALLNSDVLTGLEGLLSALFVATALAMGLIVSSVAVPAKIDL